MDFTVEYQIKDGIYFGKYPEKSHITIDVAKQIVAERLRIQNGKEYPAVLHIDGLRTADKASRAFMATEGIKGFTHAAIIATQTDAKMIMSFLIGFEKPQLPIKICQTEEQAIAWIKEFQNNNSN